MTEAAGSTAAVMVVYRAGAGIEPALRCLRPMVEDVVLVDNHEESQPELIPIAERLHVNLLCAANLGGLAGAYNRALEWLRANRPLTRRVVFLDEDSDPAALMDMLADAATVNALGEPKTAAVAPAYRDRATGLRGRYIRLQRFSLHFFPREFADLRRVAFVINSMSIWRMQALQQIGTFNEALAVDHVDTEYCLRARRCKLDLFVNGRFDFAHSIGQRKAFRAFGLDMQAGGHSPERRFMIARNTVWLARTWFLKEPAFAMLCLARMGYEAVGIIVAEDRIMAKLAALLHGSACGLIAPARPT